MPRHRWMFLSLFGLVIVVLIINFYFAFIMNSSKLQSQTESSKGVSAALARKSTFPHILRSTRAQCPFSLAQALIPP